MLIFDFDGTLVDSNGVWVEVDKIFLGRRGAPYTQEYYDMLIKGPNGGDRLKVEEPVWVEPDK